MRVHMQEEKPTLILCKALDWLQEALLRLTVASTRRGRGTGSMRMTLVT